MGSLGSQVMCDNIPGLVNKQRQLCRQHPRVMQAIGAGMKDWISECQHQFRSHRWNCNTTARDHNLFGRLLLRSEWRGCEDREGTLVLFEPDRVKLETKGDFLDYEGWKFGTCKLFSFKKLLGTKGIMSILNPCSHLVCRHQTNVA